MPFKFNITVNGTRPKYFEHVDVSFYCKCFTSLLNIYFEQLAYSLSIIIFYKLLICVIHSPVWKLIFRSSRYIADYFQRNSLTTEEEGLLRDDLYCERLLSREQYIDSLQRNGFTNIQVGGHGLFLMLKVLYKFMTMGRWKVAVYITLTSSPFNFEMKGAGLTTQIRWQIYQKIVFSHPDVAHNSYYVSYFA